MTQLLTGPGTFPNLSFDPELMESVMQDTLTEIHRRTIFIWQKFISGESYTVGQCAFQASSHTRADYETFCRLEIRHDSGWWAHLDYRICQENDGEMELYIYAAQGLVGRGSHPDKETAYYRHGNGDLWAHVRMNKNGTWRSTQLEWNPKHPLLMTLRSIPTPNDLSIR